jgi:hypothetical protein
MANLVKITGLQRGATRHYTSTTASGVYSDGSNGPASVRGFRVKYALGRQYNQNSTAVAATVSSGTVSWTAKYKGAYGNSIKVAIVVSGNNTPLTVATTFTASTAEPVITVYSATNGGGTATSRTIDVVNLINSDAQASQLITAGIASGFTSTSTVYAFSAASLAAGSNGTGTQDAEPPYGVAGEPLWVNVTDRTIWVVDTQDRVVQRTLQRNNWRYVSLGSA